MFGFTEVHGGPGGFRKVLGGPEGFGGPRRPF